MTITLTATATGTHNGQPVAFDISFPNISPNDAFAAAYLHLTGKALSRRRADWVGTTRVEGGYRLRCFRNGAVEIDVIIARPAKVEPAPAPVKELPYAEHATAPAFERVVIGENKLPLPAANPALYRFGGKHELPEIGARVRITYNGLGFATVTGYFTEGGYLGVLTALEVPTRNGAKCHAFGPEFEPAPAANGESL